MSSTTLCCYLVLGLLVACHTALARPHITHSPLDQVWLKRIGSYNKNHQWKIRGGGDIVAPLPHATDDANIAGTTVTDDRNATSTAATTFASPQSRIKAIFQRKLPALPSFSGPKHTLERLNQIRVNTTTAFGQRIAQLHVLETLQHNAPLLCAVLGTTTLALLSHRLLNPPKGLALPTIYALALLGSSAGFHLFLYFITVGFAMGIAIPLATALVVYNVRRRCAQVYEC